MNHGYETFSKGQPYSIWRWVDIVNFHDGVSLNGSYFLIAGNLELAYLQGASGAHVVCIVDDFGNLVRRKK